MKRWHYELESDSIARDEQRRAKNESQARPPARPVQLTDTEKLLFSLQAARLADPARSTPRETASRPAKRSRTARVLVVALALLAVAALAYFAYPALPLPSVEFRGLRVGASSLDDVERVLAARDERVLARSVGSVTAITTRGAPADQPERVSSVTYAVDTPTGILESVAVRTLWEPTAEQAFRAAARERLLGSRIEHWSDSSRLFVAPGARISLYWQGTELLTVYSRE